MWVNERNLYLLDVAYYLCCCLSFHMIPRTLQASKLAWQRPCSKNHNSKSPVIEGVLFLAFHFFCYTFFSSVSFRYFFQCGFCWCRWRGITDWTCCCCLFFPTKQFAFTRALNSLKGGYLFRHHHLHLLAFSCCIVRIFSGHCLFPISSIRLFYLSLSLAVVLIYRDKLNRCERSM